MGRSSDNGRNNPSQEPAHMPTSYLMCRGLNHPWEPEIVYATKLGNRNAHEIHLICRRCGSTRVDLKAKNDRGLLYRRYDMAELYLVSGISNRKAWNREIDAELWERLEVPDNRKE